MRRWDVQTGEFVDYAEYQGMTEVALQPQGGLIALGQSSEKHKGDPGFYRDLNRLRLSNWKDTQAPTYVLGTGCRLGSRVAFTPDGKHLLAGGNSGIVHVLRLPNTPGEGKAWLEQKLKETPP